MPLAQRPYRGDLRAAVRVGGVLINRADSAFCASARCGGAAWQLPTSRVCGRSCGARMGAVPRWQAAGSFDGRRLWDILWPVTRRPGTVGSRSICRASVSRPGWSTSGTRPGTAAGSSWWSGARRPECGNCRRRGCSTLPRGSPGQLARSWQRGHPGRIGRAGPAGHGDERQGRAPGCRRDRTHAAGRRHQSPTPDAKPTTPGTGHKLSRLPQSCRQLSRVKLWHKTFGSITSRAK